MWVGPPERAARAQGGVPSLAMARVPSSLDCNSEGCKHDGDGDADLRHYSVPSDIDGNAASASNASACDDEDEADASSIAALRRSVPIRLQALLVAAAAEVAGPEAAAAVFCSRAAGVVDARAQSRRANDGGREGDRGGDGVPDGPNLRCRAPAALFQRLLAATARTIFTAASAAAAAAASAPFQCVPALTVCIASDGAGPVGEHAAFCGEAHSSGPPPPPGAARVVTTTPFGRLKVADFASAAQLAGALLEAVEPAALSALIAYVGIDDKSGEMKFLTRLALAEVSE